MGTADYHTDYELADSADAVSLAQQALAESGLDIVSMTRADTADDLRGIDYWATDIYGSRHGIDVKIRRHDCRAYDRDDIALEYRSSSRNAGWLLGDGDHDTDYVVWIWLDTGRYEIIPYTPLRYAAEQMMSHWINIYESAEQNNGLYTSGCVYVPRSLLLAAVRMATMSQGGE